MASRMLSKFLIKPRFIPCRSFRSTSIASQEAVVQPPKGPGSDLAKNPPTDSAPSETRGRRRGRPRDNFLSLVPGGGFDLWSPLGSSRSLRQMIDTMDRLFDTDMFMPGSGDAFPRNVGRMPWDIVEKPEAYHMRIDMPGFEKSDLSISIEDEDLVIKGERKASDDGFESQRSVNTRMLLPKEALKDQIKAELKNGVLNVIVPREQVPEEKRHLTVNVE